MFPDYLSTDCMFIDWELIKRGASAYFVFASFAKGEASFDVDAVDFEAT